MKLRIQVQTLDGDTTTLDLMASPGDLVRTIKERIVDMEPNPFPDRSLRCENAKLSLPDSKTLSECGIEEGAKLHFAAVASEQALLQQLEQLMRPGEQISIQELGLLYTLKHGVSTGDALRGLGKNATLKLLLESASKRFVVKGERVATSAESKSETLGQVCAHSQELKLKISVALELPSYTAEAVSFELRAKSNDAVASILKRAEAAALVPFAGGRLLKDGKELCESSCLADCKLAADSQLVFAVCCSEQSVVRQMAAILLKQGSLSVLGLDNAYCLRHGGSATQAVRMLGWGETLKNFVERKPEFSAAQGCIALAQVTPAECLGFDSARADNDSYLRLQAKLSDRVFAEDVSGALDRFVETIFADTFLNVRSIVKGGVAGKGVAIPGAATAQVIAFLDGLPPTGQDIIIPSLARSLASVLNEGLRGHSGIQHVHVEDGVLHVSVDGPLKEVQVFLSPAFDSHRDAIDALPLKSHKARNACTPALMESRVRFIQKQPEGVKSTIRLLRWWREQRHWTSDRTRPGDELLELVVVHILRDRVPTDLCTATKQVLEALSRFEDVKLMWPWVVRSHMHDQDDWKFTLDEHPLVMDPVDPFANPADPHGFQSAELMQYARCCPLFMVE